MAEAEAAVGLVDQDAGEAHLGELLPQIVAEAVAAALVAPVAQLLRDRAFLRHEAARAVAEHRLVFGEIERQGLGLLCGRIWIASSLALLAMTSLRAQRSNPARRRANPGSFWR